MPLFLSIALIILAAFLSAVLAYYFARAQDRADRTRWEAEQKPQIQAAAVRGSRSAILGQAAEQLAPFLPGFGFNPKDAKFIGQPVDYVIFDGLADGALRRVVFLEIKTAGRLNGNERQLRDIVTEKAVEWKEYRIPPEAPDPLAFR
jgi:predicted Holliday junction resolvase-like endonuclease